jgi:hypothetical protein
VQESFTLVWFLIDFTGSSCQFLKTRAKVPLAPVSRLIELRERVVLNDLAEFADEHVEQLPGLRVSFSAD